MSTAPTTEPTVEPTTPDPERTFSVLLPPDALRNDVFARAADELGVPVVVEVYADPAFVLDRLLAQVGQYHYDLIVVPGAFLAPAISEGLVQQIDPSLIPSLDGLLPSVRTSPFDPDGQFSVCKEVGYTGYAWDRQVVPDGVTSWDDFLRVAATPEVSGRVTCLAEGAELLAISPWSRGEPASADFDAEAAEADLRERLVPHLVDLDSDPVPRLLEGQVALAQMWNGAGRNLVRSDPDRWGYAIGAPITGVWTERYVIPAAAPDPAAAHRFIELALQPDIAIAEIDERGYNTGLGAAQEQIAELDLAELVPAGDAIYGDGLDDGAAVLATSADRLSALVVEARQELFGADAPTPVPSTAPSGTTAPDTSETTEPAQPAETAPQYDDQGRRVLRPQDTGPEVEQLQRRLTELGFSIGRIDGWYGDVTLAAVLAFQRSQGLQTDGVVGRYTWDALADPKPIVTRSPSTRGVPEGSPSDAGEHQHGSGGGGGPWAKAIVYLDSFKSEFYDRDGNLVASFPNSPGVNGLTPTGTFQVYSRSADTYYSKNPAEKMKWMVRFNGGIGFHNVPRIDGTPEPTPLGQAPSSHGCIRHADENAKQVFDNLPDGATVIVQHG